MSRSRKVVLVLATVLLVGGSALSLFAFAKAGFSLQNLSTTRDWVSSTRTLPSEAEAPHTALVVHDGYQSIRLEPTDDDAFQVEYWTNERRSVSLTDQDGVLTIEGTDEQRDGFVRFEFMSSQRAMTVVRVPRSFTGSILVETGVGDVEAAGFAGLSSVSLASSSGGVHATRIDAQDVSLSSSVGNIHAADVQAARVSATLESGSITMADVTATETLTSRTSIGDQDLRQVSAPILDVRTSSGAVHAADVAGDDLVFETSVGDIEATVVGAESDYRVEAASSVGDVNVPQGSADADRRVRAHASTGAVSIAFVAEGASDAGEVTGGDVADAAAGALGTGAGAGRGPAAPDAPSAPDAPAAPASSSLAAGVTSSAASSLAGAPASAADVAGAHAPAAAAPGPDGLSAVAQARHRIETIMLTLFAGMFLGA